MATKYCNECKFAGQTSRDQIYCEKNQTWMPKYGTCTDFQYARSQGLPVPFLSALSFIPGLVDWLRDFRP
jgi:hypothetical protein